jgi:hypothetical protein
MSTASYVLPASFCGRSAANPWSFSVRRSLFGDAVLIVFLLAQCLDGVFTYVGVKTYGISAEANPLIATLMIYVGHGTALMGAKLLAGLLGIGLHIGQVHSAVAMLAVFYLAVAVFPWISILFT